LEGNKIKMNFGVDKDYRFIGMEKRQTLLSFLGISAPFLIEQYWELEQFKNKEGKEIQTGPIRCIAEEGNDCLNVNGSPVGAI
jgi:hypothetical protein